MIANFISRPQPQNLHIYHNTNSFTYINIAQCSVKDFTLFSILNCNSYLFYPDCLLKQKPVCKTCRFMFIADFQIVSEDGTPHCIQCMKAYSNSLLQTSTIQSVETAWQTRFCSQVCSHQYWVSQSFLLIETYKVVK